MKIPLLLVTVFLYMVAIAQTDSLPPGVIHWSVLKAESSNGNERRNILEGRSTHLDYMEIHTTTVAAGKSPHAPHVHIELEEMIIVKEGTITMTIKGVTKILGPGSVAVAMPGDFHGIVNAGTTSATYYVIRYRSKVAVDTVRASKAGGSLLINWNEVAFNELPKGGVRNFFERPSGMLQRLEMHVTTLKEGLPSHDPHTHIAEEIILMISGNIEMQLGNTMHKAAPGDVIFVTSGILHAPKNTGKGPATYYAIQWQ